MDWEWQHLEPFSDLQAPRKAPSGRRGRISINFSPKSWKDHKKIFPCPTYASLPLTNILTARNEACWRAGKVRGSKIVVGLILLQWKGALCKARQITRFCPTPRVSQIIAKLQTNFRNIFLSTNCHNSWRNCIVISWLPFVFAPQVFSIQFLTTEHAARLFFRCGSNRFLVLVKLPKTLSPQWKHLMHKCTVLILVQRSGRQH